MAQKWHYLILKMSKLVKYFSVAKEKNMTSFHFRSIRCHLSSAQKHEIGGIFGLLPQVCCEVSFMDFVINLADLTNYSYCNWQFWLEIHCKNYLKTNISKNYKQPTLNWLIKIIKERNKMKRTFLFYYSLD